ncbi:MAG TPA: alpha-amylase, partial [Terracidiphilus sp.]|nr:alpha-amylase [Terracidiphilus sp.]
YQRPRYEEWPDQWLIDRHNREIAPLLKRRWLFAESTNFLLYDFFTPSGAVDENIFAYSNRNGGERALIVYNNRYGSTHGTVRISAAYADKGSGQLRQRSVWEGLGLSDRSSIVACRDSLTGLEYLRRAHDVADHGVTLSLHAYQSYVFLDWRELHPTAGKAWDRLCDYLGGRGVSSLDDALINLELKPVHDALRHALDPAVVRMLAEAVEVSQAAGTPSEKKNPKLQSEFLDAAWGRCEELLRPAAAAWARLAGERLDTRPLRPDSLAPVYRKYLRDAMRLLAVESILPGPLSPAARRVLPASSPQVPATALWGPVMAWCLLQVLAEAINEGNRNHTALHLFDRLRLREPLAHAFNALGLEGERGWRAAARLKVLLIVQSNAASLEKAAAGPSSSAGQKPAPSIETVAVEDTPAGRTAPMTRSGPFDSIIPHDLWQDPDVRWLTGFNEAEGHAYVVREPFEELLWWLSLPELLKLAALTVPGRAAGTELNGRIQQALAAVEKAGYRVDVLMKRQEPAGPASQPDAETRKAVATASKPGQDEPSLAPEEPKESLVEKPIESASPHGSPEDD